MITVPAFPDLLKPGAPVSTGDESGIVTAMYTTNRAPPEAIARVDLDDDLEVERYPLSSLALILDDPDRIGQTLALGWLARRLGVVVPAVGCPAWVRVAPCEWRIGDPNIECEFFIFGPPEQGTVTCPALDNPDAADAPIRALALAVETVGRRAT